MQLVELATVIVVFADPLHGADHPAKFPDAESVTTELATTVKTQVLLSPALAEQVVGWLGGENPPVVVARLTLAPAVDPVASTLMVSVVPDPPEPVHLEFVGSAKHLSIPLRLTVAVGDPVDVVNVQLPDFGVP